MKNYIISHIFWDLGDPGLDEGNKMNRWMLSFNIYSTAVEVSVCIQLKRSRSDSNTLLKNI